MNRIGFDGIWISGESSFVRILDFDLTAKVNEHGVLQLTASLDPAEEERPDCWIGKKILFGSGTGKEKKSLFAGKIQKSELFFRGKEYFGRFWCVSASQEFDQMKVCRSFQDIHMTYQELFKRIGGRERRILPLCQGMGEIGTPLIQYEETDWEFCRRIASRFCSVVIPDISEYYPQIAVGVIGGKQYIAGCGNDYKVYWNVEGVRKKKRFQDCRMEELKTYRITEEQDYHLGDKVWFLDRLLIVLEKRVFLKCGRVEREYLLWTEKAGGMLPFYNRKLKGLFLAGTVAWRDRETVKVELDIDRNWRSCQETENLYAFDYVPVSGNLLYAMPEVGARVRLYFPEEKESSGMATESIPEQQKFPESSEKIFQTKEEKTVRCKSEILECRSLVRKTGIRIGDQTGVDIFSEKGIRLLAKGSILMETKDYVVCDAPLGYHFENKGSGDWVDITGNEMVFFTDQAVIGALPQPLQNLPLIRKKAPKDAVKYAEGILGGIPQSEKLTEREAGVLGGIPACREPGRSLNLEEMAFLGASGK